MRQFYISFLINWLSYWEYRRIDFVQQRLRILSKSISRHRTSWFPGYQSNRVRWLKLLFEPLEIKWRLMASAKCVALLPRNFIIFLFLKLANLALVSLGRPKKNVWLKKLCSTKSRPVTRSNQASIPLCVWSRSRKNLFLLTFAGSIQKL